MAVRSWGQHRRGRAVNVRQGRTVDIDLRDVLVSGDPDDAGVADIIVEDGDTLDLGSLGLREVWEVWIDQDGWTLDLSDPKEPRFTAQFVSVSPHTFRLVGV